MSLIAVSCSAVFDDEQMPNGDNYITLSFKTPGVDTRGEVADNEYESAMKHIDVVIYEYDNGTYTPFHYERVNVSATPTGKARISKTKRDFKENIPYRFFIIANSTLPSSAYHNNGSILDYNTFLKLDQTDNYIHLSGIEFGVEGSIYPQMFLMDGIAYMGNSEPATAGNIVINDPNTDEDVTVKVTLRRAAAKVQITITPGDMVTLTQELMAKSNGYMVRNMPIRTTLSAEGGYPLNNSGANPYWKSSTISQTPYFELIPIKDAEGKTTNYQVKITLYCYSHTWTKDEVFERGTSVVVMLPMIYDGVEYVNNYYQISFSKMEGTLNNSYHLIKRNTYYDLRINLNAPGAEDFNEPEAIEDILYFTAPWEKIDLEVSGEDTVKYLKVNKNELYMYHTDELLDELYYSSSSPVEVTYVSGSCYYYDKYNQKVNVTDRAILNTIYGTVDEDATSGNVAVHSADPTNNTIRYFQLQVKNQEGMTEIINVKQYPLIYITNNLPWYSYRDDYYYRTTGGHSWEGNVSTATTSGDSPTTYRYAGDHITSIATIRSVDTENKTATYTYTSATPGSSKGWTASKVRGDAVKNSQNYNILYYKYTYNKRQWGAVSTSSCEQHNVRNYHVRVMASSDQYTLGRPALDEYGFTAGDTDNAKLVSPSFVIASRLGAVLSTYSNLSGMSNDKKLVVFADHCKNYVEVDDVNDDKKDPVVVYDNWRLPTEAELKIIMDLQGGDGVNADAIDFLLNGGYYMSASGPVFNPKNTDGTKEQNNPWNASDVAIRCVRDAY